MNTDLASALITVKVDIRIVKADFERDKANSRRFEK